MIGSFLFLLKTWIVSVMMMVWDNKLLLHVCLFAFFLYIQIRNLKRRNERIVCCFAFCFLVSALACFGWKGPVTDESIRIKFTMITNKSSFYVRHGTSDLAIELRDISLRADNDCEISVEQRDEFDKRSPEYEEQQQQQWTTFESVYEYYRRRCSDSYFELEKTTTISRLLEQTRYTLCEVIRREKIPVDVGCWTQWLRDTGIASAFCLAVIICTCIFELRIVTDKRAPPTEPVTMTVDKAVTKAAGKAVNNTIENTFKSKIAAAPVRSHRKRTPRKR